jgi:vitamin B12 transporter
VGRFGTWTNKLTYIDGHSIQNGVSVNNFFRRPNFTMNSILTLSSFKGFTLAPAFKYVGTRLKGPYDVEPDLMPAYYTLNCFISYQINQLIRLFTSLNNITNQQYFDIVGYNSKRFNKMSGAYFNF